MGKFYFFKTCKVNDRPRLRALPGQTGVDGKQIDTGLNVQADSIIRGSYPRGTVFGSDMLELRYSMGGSGDYFYSAGAIYPMGLPLSDYIVGSHVPSESMSLAYEAFLNRVSPGGWSIIHESCASGVGREDFISMLKGGVVHFQYRKTDGTPRMARGTLCFETLCFLGVGDGNAKHSRQRAENPDTEVYYDLDAKGWRSFRWDGLISFEAEDIDLAAIPF